LWTIEKKGKVGTIYLYPNSSVSMAIPLALTSGMLDDQNETTVLVQKVQKS
jgi:hypothetical protein